MKHLVVGAGATFAQALELGIHPSAGPPLIRDFARKTWSNYTPAPLLSLFLRQLGHGLSGEDPREVFYRLEEGGETNVERLFEFIWQNKDLKIPEIDQFGGFWRNFLYHGIGSPIQFMMLSCFREHDGWKDLSLTKSVASTLEPDDLVLNLNYDTVFELALDQSGKPFCYSPNIPSKDKIQVCKPHGSLNLVANDESFAFGQPSFLGMPQPQGFESYSGIVPPRLNKTYAQHPISKIILAPVHGRRPRRVILWGVGLTDSDTDLIDLFKGWSDANCVIETINPDPGVALRARDLFGCNVKHFANVPDWLLS